MCGMTLNYMDRPNGHSSVLSEGDFTIKKKCQSDAV